MQHILSIQQFRITLAEACWAQGIELVEWVDEKILLRQPPVRVTLTGEQGERLQVALRPDAVFQIRLNTGKILTACLELDRATTVLRANKYQVRSMRRKYSAYLTYLQLLNTGQVAPVWGTNFIVTTVGTSSFSRTMHLREVCEDASDHDPHLHHFWFGYLPQLTAETILTSNAWLVGGRGDTLHRLLPQT
jgi:hypothetical protein